MNVSVKKIAGSVFMKKNETKGISIGKVFRKIGHFLYTRLILGVFNFFKNMVQKVFDFFKNIFAAAKNHPKSFKRGLGSFFLMGFGQLRNKQWYKAIPIFLMLTVFILIEISTSSYIYAIGEISTYAPREGILYFFRDYGGFFTKGVWGFFTLGKLVLGDAYRGQMIVVYDRIMTWKSADNSQVLLGEGIIAIVLILILFITWIFSIKDAYTTHLKVQETGKLETFNIFIKRVWNDYFAYIIIIPSAVLIFFFTLI